MTADDIVNLIHENHIKLSDLLNKDPDVVDVTDTDKI